MSEPDTQMFRLLSPDGQEIMAGPMSALMERLPDTHDRNAALEAAVRAAKEAVEAEERLQDARACAAQIISDTVTRLTHRLDAYLTRQAEQRRRDAEEAERQEQEEIQRALDQLPDPDDPDDPDPLTAAGDDDQLTAHPPVDPERYGPGEREDAEAPVKPALSYGKVPLSYVKKHDTGLRDAEGDLPEGLENRSPAPLGTDPIYDPANLGKPEDPKQVPPVISFNQ
jgi:vacuolar-type H+-ATPase subunit H